MGLFGSDNDSTQAILAELAKNRGLYSQIELPKYNQYTPEKYDNESATAKLTSEDPVMKSKQLEALSQLQGLSHEGLNDADVAGFEKAREMGDQMAHAKTGAVMQDAQARGVAGGGLEFALREQGNQDAAQRAQDAALAQSAARANQRGQYLQSYASQLGGVRDQDYRADAANTNVINNFNQMNTQARNQTRNANTGLDNSAFMYNEGLKDKNYSNELGKTDRIAGTNTQQGNIIAAQNEAANQRSAGREGAIVGMVGAGLNAYASGGRRKDEEY